MAPMKLQLFSNRLGISLVLIVVHFCFLLVVNAEEVDHQVGGRDTKIWEFPWFTAIRKVEDTSFRCSGALIGSHYVLTAAHCVDNTFSTIVEVGYWCGNRFNCGRANDAVGVLALYRHRTAGQLGGDLVLLELARGVNFAVTPAVPYLGEDIHPNQAVLRKGREMLMIGGGRDGTTGGDGGGETSAFVKKVRVKYLPPKKCRKKVSNPLRLTRHIVCSTGQDGSPCAGDSGAAIIVPGRGPLQNRNVIMAIHNFGPRKCAATREKKPLGHFRMTDATHLLLEIVCRGNHPEDWCGPFSATTPPPTLPPTRQEPPKLEATLLHTLEGHQGVVRTVAFNADGSRLLSGGHDGVIQMWDPIEGGAAISNFTGHSDRILSLKWSPSNSLFASTSFDKSVRLWRVNEDSGPSLVTIDFSTPRESVAWHPASDDTVTLVSKSDDNDAALPGVITMLNASNGRIISTVSAQEPSPLTIAYHPRGHPLASAGVAGKVILWETNNSILRTWRGHAHAILDVCYSPRGEYLATASWDKSVRIWQVDTGTLFNTLKGSKDWVHSVAWSPDGTYIVAGSLDGRVRIWSVDGERPLLVLKQDGNVWAVDWSSDGKHIAHGDTNSVKVWKIEILGGGGS